MEERRILYFKNYFMNFYNGLEAKAQEKIDFALMLIKSQNIISERFTKHIEEGIYELRARQKTPKNEIEKAKRIKKEYYESKE